MPSQEVAESPSIPLKDQWDCHFHQSAPQCGLHNKPTTSSLNNSLLFILPGRLLVVGKWLQLPLVGDFADQKGPGIAHVETVQVVVVDEGRNHGRPAQVRVDLRPEEFVVGEFECLLDDGDHVLGFVLLPLQQLVEVFSYMS